ncbi:AaceriAEL283Cp [[Ashbya] aceris (nom. inval.)]|nr:AaceriAEL283Cp [[Ashbya] aceris (nom. inval.)]
MSVCLVVTKSVATATLGIYTGMVVTRQLVLSPQEWIGVRKSAQKNSFGGSELYSLASGALASVSTLFFGVSYFGAPAHWRHPYLLYCALGIPLTWALATVGNCECTHVLGKLLGCGAGAGHTPAAEEDDATSAGEEHDDIISEDSIVDLSRHTSGDDHAAQKDAPACVAAAPGCAIARYTSALVAVLVFAANVVGCLGEAL